VQTLARVAGRYTLLFCVVDDHVHVVVGCDRAQAGRLGRALQLSLRRWAAVPLEPGARVRPVESRAHLERLVEYVVTQPVHHGLPVHPALWTGSCFLDLVGARVVGALGQKLQPLLPRLKLTQVIGHVGLPPRGIVPADDARVRREGAFGLASAAGVVLAASRLDGRSKEAEAVRSLAAFVGAGVGISSKDTAEALDVTMRSAQRLAHSRADKALVRGIRVYLTLKDLVTEAMMGRVLPPSQLGMG